MVDPLRCVASILLGYKAARLFLLPPHARSCKKRHEEATRSYEEVEANIFGGADVLFCFCGSFRAEARPERPAAQAGRAAEGQSRGEERPAAAAAERR